MKLFRLINIKGNRMQLIILTFFFISCSEAENNNLIQSENNLTLENIEKEDAFKAAYQSGYLSLQNGEFTTAIEKFNESISLDSTDPDSYYCRGYSLSALGNNQDAILDFNKTIALKPDYQGAYFSRGVSYNLTGQLEKAIADYQTVVSMDPGFSNAWFNMGLAKIDMGLKSDGCQDIFKASQLNDERAKTFYETNCNNNKH